MVGGLPCLNLFARWQKVRYSLSMLASLAHGYSGFVGSTVSVNDGIEN